MPVYVDDMFKYKLGKYQRMKMSHMVSDSLEELHDMAEKIGMKRKWFQNDHYDVSLKRRELAIKHGAIEITMREAVKILKKAGLR
jgi:FMN phosphatase YigB (HAD superfamily)